jgi:hypothetical protein
MRMIVVVAGALIALMGVVWALQGLGVLLGSFMSNDPSWIAIGSITSVVGFGLVVFGIRTGTASRGL